jgi:cytochrome P450
MQLMLSNVRKVRGQVTAGKKPQGQVTVLHELLQSNLPTSEKSDHRISQEGRLVIGAGTHTTARTLAVGTFYLLNNPRVFATLKSEISTVIPANGTPTPLTVLEKLPYLTAVVKESLRLNYGPGTRMSRVSPIADLEYNSFTIPRGTPMSMSVMHIHQDERYFPDHRAFKPERWLENPHLDRFLMSFGGGSRACVGRNLAMAELYLTIAGLASTFGTNGATSIDDQAKLELFQTDLSDVEMQGDQFFPRAKLDSKGMRIKVVENKFEK